MLYAASVKVACRNYQKRIDLVIEAADQTEAETKALKQAKKMCSPARKTTYSVVTIVDEREADQVIIRTSPESTSAEKDVFES